MTTSAATNNAIIFVAAKVTTHSKAALDATQSLEAMDRINSVVDQETMFYAEALARTTCVGARVTTTFAAAVAQTFSREDEEMMSSMEDTRLTISTSPMATTKSLTTNPIKAIKLFPKRDIHSQYQNGMGQSFYRI